MDSEHFQRIKELFHAAADLDPKERSAYLDQACQGDPELRDRVDSLLAADEPEVNSQRAQSLQVPPAGWAANRLIGSRLGQYHLKRVISTGGMGTVYEALQEKPRRTVAVKVMREGIVSKSTLRRFEYESQILARLRHPGIAQVFEAGTHLPDGDTGQEEMVSVPYFVMEYIPNARSITEYAYEKNLPTSERLNLFVQVCEALHHGHQKGIIHRDLKPQNILVDSHGQVKIIDFGVARATDSDLALTTLQTEVGQLIGTLQYMSPEQCEADPHDLDIRSDVYSLGMVLYELLCKQLPYDVRKLSVYEAVQRIRDEQPKRPSTTLRILKGDVETIVLKALEKDRDRRYQSTDELRRDIGRFLKGEPISARPPSVIYQLRSFARRNKVLVAGVLAVFVVLVAGVVVSTSLYFKAVHESEMARGISDFFDSMLASVDPRQLNLVSGFRMEEESMSVTRSRFGRKVSVAEMIGFAAEYIEEAFVGKPELEAKVRERIGMTLYGLAQYNDAIHQLESALEIRRDIFGDRHGETLCSQVQLAHLLSVIGSQGESEKLARGAYEEMQDLFGREHPHTLTCATVLAKCLAMQKKFEESDRLFRDTLESQERVLGPENRNTLWTRCQWAFTLIIKAKINRAFEHAKFVYDITHRPNSPYTPDDYISFYSAELSAHCYSFWGEYSRSVPLFRSALEKRRRIIGDHPFTFLSMWGLANSLDGDETIEEREAFYMEAYSGFQESLGDGYFGTIVLWSTLADFLAFQGRFDEVEDLYLERLNACRRTLGEKHHITLKALNSMASMLMNRGKIDQGEEEYKEWVELNAHKFGEQHRLALAAMAAAAEALSNVGRIEKAREYTEHALDIWRGKVVPKDKADPLDLNAYAGLLLTSALDALRDPGEALVLAKQANELSGGKNPEILSTLAKAYNLTGDAERALESRKMAIAAVSSNKPFDRRAFEGHEVRFLLRKGDIETAERLLAERDARLSESMGKGSRATKEYLLDDALLLVEEGCHEMAEPRMRDLLDSFNGKFGDTRNWKTPWAKTILGRCLAGLRRYEEAEPLLLEGYRGLEKNPLVSVKVQRQTLEWIVHLYQEWDKPEEAASWRKKLKTAPSVPALDHEGE
ncbi:MAG: protein kinase domain-containing protein [Planctomycetota bacterium]|jgi:serine/threonine protein kinase